MSTSLKYKREGYAQTRDALAWVGAYAPQFKFGLTLADVSAGLEYGYASVRPLLKDSMRISQWERYLALMREAVDLFAQSKVHEGKLRMQEAEELFNGLRRIRGRSLSRQELANTEHGANEVDE